jgi:hypothetical protein
MKIKQLPLVVLSTFSMAFAQDKGSFWKTSETATQKTVLSQELNLPTKKVLDLDVTSLKNYLSGSVSRFSGLKSAKKLTLPNTDGSFESYLVYENSNMEPELAARFPEIKSYIGIGIDSPTTTIYFSVSPLGFKSMKIAADDSAEFIEPYSSDLASYTVYKKSDKARGFSKFDCATIDKLKLDIDENTSVLRNANDGKLRTFRLALSVTGEYTAYFGGTVANALAAVNNTMTRVNGVFEKDFNSRMVLISNTSSVIYTNASTDPYSPSTSLSNWNQQLQTTLTNVIGNANYDVGHLFGKDGGGGNAGCIGCVCVNPTTSVPLGKGSAYTSPNNGIPSGDTFDIDYVAHEFGHQFGANHTFSMSNEGTGVNMEPGSGSTIMGYAGITNQDVQPNSDAYFHAISIRQVTDNIKAKTCPAITQLTNSTPTANAGLDYTIPKGTPFLLTGSGTDADGDALTYIWEQIDNAASSATNASSAASGTRTSGPTFRSYSPSTSSSRYFPRIQSILAGATTTAGTEITVEAVPTVARTMNFRFTSRDNKAGGGSNSSDDMIVTVNGTAGPFTVSAPNTAVSWPANSSQTVTWNVSGTTANGVNCANVDIFISTNGGTSWSTLLAGTPNDGSQAVTVPNTPSTTCRIMVKGANHIFLDVSNVNFTIGSASTDTSAPTAPTLSASGTTSNATNLSWSGATDNVGVTSYDVFQGSSLLGNTASTSFAVTGLAASTTYSFSVRAKDAAGNSSVASNAVSVTTTAGSSVTYCASTSSNTNDERIGRVQLGTINNPSTGTAGYENFTSISTNLTRGSSSTITITPTWTGTVYSEGYAVWIDYNKDGDFADTGELVYSRTATTTTPVSGSFTVPSATATGSTRMRVSMKYNAVPTSCESFTYGQVEDYTVNIVSTAREDQEFTT